MSVLAELKRRNVVRVTALYGLAAWLILQVADVLVPTLGLPGWVMRLVALLLILGAERVVSGLKSRPRLLRAIDWLFACVFGAFAVRILATQAR